MIPYISLIEGYRSITSSKDCFTILNTYKSGKWKRTAKFNLPTESTPHTVRVFTNGKEFVTIIDSNSEVLLCKNLDLKKHKPLIDKINELAKSYFTHDYGAISYNPWTKKLWVSGGDGGIGYCTTLTAKEVAKRMEDYDEDDPDLKDPPDFHKEIKELKDSKFEAEYSPCSYYDKDQDEEEMNYIEIGHIIDVGQYS